jgi:hypothetical protein
MKIALEDFKDGFRVPGSRLLRELESFDRERSPRLVVRISASVPMTGSISVKVSNYSITWLNLTLIRKFDFRLQIFDDEHSGKTKGKVVEKPK